MSKHNSSATQKQQAESSKVAATNFIYNIIDADLAAGRHHQLVTRFPPEPNGYLHIGHAKSICLNFGIQQDYAAQCATRCHLRFDDTNPEKESSEYAKAIQEDIRWLGFAWDGEVKWASDYFEALYTYAQQLIRKGLAYVCELDAEQIRQYRGSLTEHGRNSPYRERHVAENLALFAQMRAGEFTDGSRTLRLKIDMASPNINMRDPVIYRIRRAHHIRTGDAWCIYPMYDYTHCISDAIEGVSHSLCTLEFEDHRPLYDWILEHIDIDCHPRQIEFARLELLYTVTSKRKLNRLVQQGVVSGWDDPRMPTIAGMRRRGYSPGGLRLFAKRCGVAKAENVVDLAVLEGAVRETLEGEVPRVMAVVHPLKVTLRNFDPAMVRSRDADFHPQRPELGCRQVRISQSIWIERDDFSETPPKGWQRLVLGGEVRLRYAYVIRCERVIKDAQGKILELVATLDYDTLGCNPQGRKVKGVIHWVSVEQAVAAQVYWYERLFTLPKPDTVEDSSGKALVDGLNEASEKLIQAWVEPCVAEALPETRYQFERLGYFITDRYRHRPGEFIVFNRTVGLKDTWQKR